MKEEICSQCGRPRHSNVEVDGQWFYNICPDKAKYVYATHEPYGCDTGCCGHIIHVANKAGEEIEHAFYFTHPSYDYEAHKDKTDEQGHPQLYELNEAATKLNLPINWEKCEIIND